MTTESLYKSGFSPARTARKHFFAFALAILAGAVLFTYWGAFGGDFVWDDIAFIAANGFLDDPANLTKILASGDTVGLGEGVHNPYYRPVTTLTFALEKLLWDIDPTGYHVTNVLLHLLVCFLIFAAARKMMGSPQALLAALIFAVHPANSEPVVYISARADLICALFMTAAFYFHLKSEEKDKSLNFILSMAAFTLALFSKIVAGVFPLIILWRLYSLGRPKGEVALKFAHYAAVAAVFLIIRSLVLPVESWGQSPLETRVATSATTLATYLRHALLPFDLKVFYDFPIRTTLADPVVISSWALVIAVIASAFLLRKKMPAVSLGIIWFFAGLLPVCGLAMILSPTVIADRYLYIPLIGVSMALSSAAVFIYERRLSTRNIPALKAVVAAFIILSASYTTARVDVWNTDESFWRRAIKDAPELTMPYKNYAFSLARAGKTDEAESRFLMLKAMGIIDPKIDINLSKIYLARNDIERSVKYAENALAMNVADSGTLAWYGCVMLANGNLVLARRASEKALEGNKYNYLALDNIAQIDRIEGNNGGAN
ncbi:hypothetical protein FDZ71_02315 [bacterium]|nr:MAG: hypothetical protein FDZ71_02315 [bacterium]